MVEAIIVLATMAVLAAIAVPRMSAAGQRARIVQADANEHALQKAVDFYTAEHGDRSPAVNPDGSITNSGALFLRRLLLPTDDLGTLDPAGIFGPYLSMAPMNPITGTSTIRIDGPDFGTGTAGWRFDSESNTIRPDDTTAAARLAKRLSTGGSLGAEGDAEAAKALEVGDAVK